MTDDKQTQNQDTLKLRRRRLFLLLIFVLVTSTVIARHRTRSGPVTSQMTKLAEIQDERINESSGMALSIAAPDSVWLHNDSGDKPRIFQVGLDGETRCVVTLRTRDEPYDWEDMCSFSANNANWLLIADVGDNSAVRSKGAPVCRLLLCQEPIVNWKGKVLTLTIDPVSVTEFAWEGGPRNCESIAVDVESKEILLVSKTQPLECALYSIPLNLEPGQHTATAKLVSRVGVPFATGMDVSRDGRKMVVTTMISAILIVRRDEESWAAALKRSPTVVSIPPMKQCETICFLDDGRSVLVHSEGKNQAVWKIQLPELKMPAPEPTADGPKSDAGGESDTNGNAESDPSERPQVNSQPLAP